MILLVALLGVLVGSFLNVVIYRVPRGESIAYPGSKCTFCGRSLRPLENIPIISFVIQKGKCKGCSSKISPIYPSIELLVGVMFVWIYIKSVSLPSFLFGVVLMSTLVVVLFIDLRHEIIPDSVNLFLGVSGLCYALFIENMMISNSLYGALAGGGVLFLIALVGPMGGGDIKLMAAAGLWLGLFPTIFCYSHSVHHGWGCWGGFY